MSDERSPETEYYRNENVLITRSVAEMGDRTIVMANVTSVSLSSENTSTFWDGFGFGCLFIVFGYFAIVLSLLVVSLAGGDLLGIVMFGAAAVAAIVFLKSVHKAGSHTLFHVDVTSASGESRILTSRDRAEVEQIIAALRRAIVDRG